MENIEGSFPHSGAVNLLEDECEKPTINKLVRIKTFLLLFICYSLPPQSSSDDGRWGLRQVVCR